MRRGVVQRRPFHAQRRTGTIAGHADGLPPCTGGAPMMPAPGHQRGPKMRNPFMTKNPFMSAWLSSANKVMGAARGQSTAAAKRQMTSIQAEAARQVLDFWSG